MDHKPLIIFIMGPTASGKTDLAMALSERLPSALLSVDSAMVYRGMDIGTAKPTAAELAAFPHRLIDLCDPVEAYSVAQFCEDAYREIDSVIAEGKTPILVGGTMMYFKSLLSGLAQMPATDEAVRLSITQEAEEQGWPAMHAQLAAVDPDYAAQLHPNHSQRISRALEIYRLSGKTMSYFRSQQDRRATLEERYRVLQLALLPEDRAWLHHRIEQRFRMMIELGFVDEVEALRARGSLNLDLPSMRAVGYRQVWQYLDNEFSFETMVDKGVAATRQLAKRQLTWLRSWPDIHFLSADTVPKEKNIQKSLNFLPKGFI